MKKMLKLLLVTLSFICSMLFVPSPASAFFLFEVNVEILRPFAIPDIPAINIPDLPAIDIPATSTIIDPAPIFVPQEQVKQMKYNPDKGGIPRALRKDFGSKKEAREAAKRAGGGKEPRHDPHGHDKETHNSRRKQTNKKPHYHPASSHDHYYYTHRVVAGDTLSGIAKKYHTTYQKIAEINGIKNPNLIRVGQIIKIPK